MKISGNKRGMVLLFAIFMMVILLGISSAMVMRAVSVGKAGIHKDSGARAFYEAEAGLSYAYAEESGKNFSWYTHEDKDTPIITSHEVTLGSITVSFQPPAPPFVTASAGIDALTGCYNVAGRNFLVKTYPEQVINPDTGQPEYTGVTIVHSQATINGISRTLEYRLGRASVYQYFFFYPGNTNFSGGTYNGRNYGGIHVNGDINLTGSTNLYFLTSLTCGSQAAGRGFIRVPQRDTYLDLAATPDGETPVPIPAAPGVPGQLPCQFHDGINYFFYNPITTFRSGPVGSYTTTVLPAYLDNTLYPGAAWNYPKYRGTSTTPLHYRINDTDLRNFATYEVDNNWNAANPNLNLLETSKSIEVSGIGTATELSMFNTLRSSGTAEQWAQFWNAWRSNHSNDYQAERSAGIFTGGQDWERRLFVAWQNYYLLNGIPQRTYSINREWWNDLRYGEDRTTVDYRAPAEAINVATGQGINAYYINTEQQGSAWQTYLAANRFNVAGENRTLIQDRSQGASHVDTGDLMGSTPDQNVVRQKALAGGIYIGLDDAGDFQNPIAECTSEKQFYNAAYPASDGSVYTGYYQYKPSSV
ncbi:MAG: hypothetical protein FJZ13_04840, partial [Candidatus Omnitrophica bacterium]|nr:hypothetical protein [Candidatus Omnitrophota bacterium]